MRNLSVKFPITRSGRDRSSSITHTFHIPCNYWCLTCPQCPHCPPPMNVKIQIDKFKHAEIQFRHKMTIYPSKKFKIAYLYCAQFPFILTKYQNYFLWGLFINVYPTNYPSPWQDLRPPAWWQPRAAPNQIRRSARAIPRLGRGGDLSKFNEVEKILIIGTFLRIC